MRSSTGSSRFHRALLAVLAAVALLGFGVTPAGAAPSSGAGPRWVGTWAMSVQPPTDFSFGAPTWSPEGFTNHTVRQVVRISAGGTFVRIRLSNVYGSAPLRLAGATVAKAGEGAAVRPGSLRPLTFGHGRSVVVPTGRELVSDAAVLPTAPVDRLTVSLYFAEPTGPATFHASASATSYRAVGDHRFARDGAAFTETTQSFYYLAGVEVSGAPARQRGTVVAFGDSITDGAFSTLDADNRYPDQLAERLAAAGRPLGVLNAGISGNLVLQDSPCFGEKATARFQRDALDRPGVRAVIVLEAINDIISVALKEPSECGLHRPDLEVQELIDAHRAMIRAAHARGVKIIGGTILPYKDNIFGAFTPRGEEIRDALNHWIRTSGEYDAVADFERALVAPNDPDLLNPVFDSGDKLHPNDAGYDAMAAAVDPASL